MDAADIKDLKKYKNKVKDAERKSDVQEEAFYCALLADLHSKYEHYEDALEYYQRALGLYEGLGKDLEIAVASRLLGECYCKTGELDKALHLHKRYLNIATKCHDEVEVQRALTTLGNTYRSRHEVALTRDAKQGELEKGKSAFTRSLELCETLKSRGAITDKDFSDMKGRLLYNLGLVYGDLGDTAASFQYLNKALPIFQSISSLDILYLCQRALSDLYIASGKLKEAQTLLDSACKTAQRAKDKASHGDAMLAKALVLLQREDFQAGRHVLKKLHHMKGTNLEKRDLLKIYKSAKCFEGHLKALKQTEEVTAKISVYEKLADSAVDMGLPRLALHYYNKQLSASVSVQTERSELAGVHISLAQTYEDLKLYAKAIDHYKQEIECRGNDQEQISRSWLNIALNQENSGVKYKTIQATYVNAYNAAKKAGHRQLQVRSLAALVELFKLHKDSASLQKVEDQMKHVKTKYNITDSQLEEDSQVSTVGDDSDDEHDDDDDCASVMSELTESEEEEESEAANIRAVRRGGKKALIFERNKLGETPLHRACIKGNVKEVQHLIARGHPLNPQDNNGWTPLHEATNNGHLEVTESLLKAGADINNRGGQGCKGVTPLIDAATNGHLEIIKLLIQHGANVIAKDDLGHNALHYFEKVYRESKADLDQQTDSQCREVTALLREKMPEHRDSLINKRSEVLSQLTTSAHVPTTSQGARSKQDSPQHTGTVRRSRNDVIMDTDSDSDGSIVAATARRKTKPVVADDTDNSENIYPSLSDDHDDGIDLSGADAYKRAIETVGRSAFRATQPSETSRRSSTKVQPALLNEDDFVCDDWLEDDLNKPIRRQKNIDCHGFFSGGGGVRKRHRSESTSPVKKARKPSERTSSSRKSNLDQNVSSSQRKRIRIDESSDEDRSSGDSVGNDITAMDSSEDELSLVDNTLTDTGCDLAGMFDDDNDHLCVIVSQSDCVSTPIDLTSTSTNSNATTSNVASGSSQVNLVKPSQSSRRFSQKQRKLTEFGHIERSKTIAKSSSGNIYNNQVVGTTDSIAALDTQQSQTPSGVVAQKKFTQGVLRLTVKVEDIKLLVPVLDPSMSKTFGWLADEVASRYYEMCGARLKLVLGRNGAHFSPSDLVLLMLEDNDQIEGYCVSRDQPPMDQTYRDACKTLKTVLYKNIQSVLQAGDRSGQVDLSNLVLRSANFRPVLKAIQHQTGIRELQLKGNRLRDSGVEELCRALPSLPNLALLGLALNDLTVESLRQLAHTAGEPGTKALQSLVTLDLGHNSLYDSSLVPLASLLSHLPMISGLLLSSCELTVKFFQNDRLRLTEVLHKSCIQSLDVSYNQLGTVGIELFLKCQNPTQITSLDLSVTLPEGRPSHFYRHLYNYASQDDCALRELKIAHCCLTAEDSEYLTSLPSTAKLLQKIDLSGNPRLPIQVLEQLIKSSISEKSSLEDVTCNGCGCTGPLSMDFVDNITEKLSAAVPLRRLEFSCQKLEKVDLESLQQVWVGKYENCAIVKFDRDIVSLTVGEK